MWKKHVNIYESNRSLLQRATSMASPELSVRLLRRWLTMYPAEVKWRSIAAGVAGTLWCFKCTRYKCGYFALLATERSIHTFIGLYRLHLKYHSVPATSAATVLYTVSQKNCANLFFCRNFVKFWPIVEIFGTRIAKRTSFSEVYSFSTSPNLCQRTIVLNADVPNCYIMLYLLACSKLMTT